MSTLGATGRGQIMEIGTYVDKLLDTELSGNVIDLCQWNKPCERNAPTNSALNGTG